MFKFFTQKKWFIWSILGSIFILISTWYQVQLDVKINEWFGEFYDTLQKALTTPNSVSEAEFIGYLFTFAKIAGLWIVIAVFTGFFTSHWVFRWRTSMADYYHQQWLNARLTEGASQRVQEDTLKFARIMEGLGTGLLDSIMTLIAFTPILWGLSSNVVIPYLKDVTGSLVWVSLVASLGCLIISWIVGIKLPGLESNHQKVESGFRKELVYGEDAVTTGASNDIERATEIAHKMVKLWGMSSVMGPMAYGEDEGEVFLGRQVTKHKHISDETFTKVDSEIRKIIDTNYSAAYKIIKDNRDILDAMAAALVEFETIDTNQIDDLMARIPMREAAEVIDSDEVSSELGTGGKDSKSSKSSSDTKTDADGGGTEQFA